jgi:hypothetical protein
MVGRQQVLWLPLQNPYYSNNCTQLFDSATDDIFHLQDNQLSTNHHFEKETTMDTRVQTIPWSFQDDMIAPRPLLYVPSRRPKSVFLGNNSTINCVCHTTQMVAYKDFPLFKEKSNLVMTLQLIVCHNVHSSFHTMALQLIERKVHFFPKWI